MDAALSTQSRPMAIALLLKPLKLDMNPSEYLNFYRRKGVLVMLYMMVVGRWDGGMLEICSANSQTSWG